MLPKSKLTLPPKRCHGRGIHFTALKMNKRTKRENHYKPQRWTSLRSETNIHHISSPIINSGLSSDRGVFLLLQKHSRNCTLQNKNLETCNHHNVLLCKCQPATKLEFGPEYTQRKNASENNRPTKSFHYGVEERTQTAGGAQRNAEAFYNSTGTTIILAHRNGQQWK